MNARLTSRFPRANAVNEAGDLGDDAHGTGYNVLLWIEEQVATTNFQPPEIAVHSANVSARSKMEAAVRSILALAQRQKN